MFCLLLAAASLWIQTPSQNVELQVEVAQTTSERERGLQGRKNLSSHEGMLFIHQPGATAHYWMDNVSIPLALIFISVDWHILEIHYGAPYSKKALSAQSHTNMF